MLRVYRLRGDSEPKAISLANGHEGRQIIRDVSDLGALVGSRWTLFNLLSKVKKTINSLLLPSEPQA